MATVLRPLLFRHGIELLVYLPQPTDANRNTGLEMLLHGHTKRFNNNIFITKII